MRLVATALAFLGLAAPAAAKPGDLDPTFAHHGRIAFAGGKGYSEASDLALGRAGRILLAGSSQGGTNAGDWRPAPVVARLTGAGRLDRRFGGLGRTALPAPGALFTRGGAERVAALAGGGVVVAATLRYLDRPDEITVRRLRRDGSQVWATTLAAADEPWSLAGLGLDRDGRILIAAVRVDGPVLSGVVVRLLADGRLDPGYRVELPAGFWAVALLVNADGSAFVAGHQPGNGGRARERVFAIDAHARVRPLAGFALLDRSDAGGRTTALAQGPHGTLLIAGDDFVEGRVTGWIRRVHASGATDRAFAVRGRRRVAQVIDDIARDRRGRILLAGAFEAGYVAHASVTRLTPDGRADRRFGRRGVRVLQLGARAGTRFISSEARASRLPPRAPRRR